MPATNALTLDELRAHMNRALADHSLCVQEGTPDERTVRPSLKWFVEDYLPKVTAEPAKPTAALIEIVEKGHSTDGNEGVIVPNQVRINGTPLLIPAGQQIKVHSITLNENERGPYGEDAACVTLTLFARRVTIAAEGDL
ncbi:MAG TPA: hypothetical protein VHA75_16360 [Rugosimonospora sp.]|nr:hypothetical protein [Rugosimonospora sp.]